MNFNILAAGIAAYILLSKKSDAMVNTSGFSNILRWKDLAAQNSDANIGSSDILAIIANESWGDPNATPPGGGAGEIGLMQVTLPAFLDVDAKFNLNYSHQDLKDDPEKQVFCGAEYLKLMYKRFQTLELAVRAYNQGPGNIVKNPAKGQEYFDRFLRNKAKIEKGLINV